MHPKFNLDADRSFTGESDKDFLLTYISQSNKQLASSEDRQRGIARFQRAVRGWVRPLWGAEYYPS